MRPASSGKLPSIYIVRLFTDGHVFKRYAYIFAGQCYNLISHLRPLTLEVVGAPQMTLQQFLFPLPCLPLPSVLQMFRMFRESDRCQRSLLGHGKPISYQEFTIKKPKNQTRKTFSVIILKFEHIVVLQ